MSDKDQLLAMGFDPQRVECKLFTHTRPRPHPQLTIDDDFQGH